MKILITESVNSLETPTLLQELGECLVPKASIPGVHHFDRSAFLYTMKSTQPDALLIGLEHRIDAEVLNLNPNLKVIATRTTGLNHIDVAECDKRGITVLSLRGHDILKECHATAELAIGLMIAVMRKLHVNARMVGHELYGKTLGIIGYGRVGQMVAKYAESFGMEVEHYDPASDKTATLEWLLQHSDIVSLHAIHNPGQEPIMTALEFARMKQGSYFINTARGELIDESALLNAITSGQIAGAAIDTVQENTVLHMAENIIITQHIGGNTEESLKRTELAMAQTLKEYLATLK